ncbi:MAG: cytochrome c biogenesis protein CcsA [Candidatus Heimdallarchaeota archaeon]|nr:cytochrome c biogenesis protein CcsA [Candidatus Heimdallarchaeota archaeon]
MTDLELIMATWASRQGAMILWTALMNSIALFVLIYLKNERSDPIVYRSITILLVMTTMIAVFAASPRNPTAFETGPDFVDGIGLTPSLLSFWQVIHPPIAFLGYSAFIFPYAAGLAILSLKKDSIEILPKVTWLIDFMMMLGWVLTSLFIVAGSLWGYEENWTGFWAWDPVEVASLVMWAASTIYFHAKTHVPKDHPLLAFTATLGWVGVTFAAFIVRSGLLEGLHVYVKSRENQIMSVVFGLMLIGTTVGLIYAISKNDKKIIPDEIFNWHRYKNKAPVLTFWSLVLLTVVNTVGLIMQLINAVFFEQENIPYDYYIFTNGILLISLAILFLLCEFKPVDWSQKNKYRLFAISALTSAIALIFILDHNPFIYILEVLLFTIFLSMVVNAIKTVYTTKKLKKFSMQLIHISIIMLIISYTSVDQSSIVVEETLIPGKVTNIEEFGFSLNATRIITTKASNVRIDIIKDGDIIGDVLLTQGLYGSSEQYWQRGDWQIELARDYFFRFQDNTENVIFPDPTRFVNIELQEKPLANMFRLTFGLLVIMMFVGLYVKIRMRSNGMFQ